MSQSPWFDYDGRSSDELFALATSHRIDSLVCAFEAALGRKAFYRGATALSVPEQDCLAIEALEREVNNGGYAQFFNNSSNAYAASIVPALQRAGCPATAAITTRALVALGPATLLTPAGLEARMMEDDPERDARLSACDEAYYASGEDIAGALFTYLERERATVRFSRADVEP